MKTLEDIQKDTERESVMAGVDRYRALLAARGTSEAAPGRRLVAASIARLSDAIKVWTEDAQSGMAQRNAGVVHMIAEFDPDVLAYLAARVAVECLDKRIALTSFATKIATRAEAVRNHEAIKVEAPGLYVRMQKALVNSSDDYCPVRLLDDELPTVTVKPAGTRIKTCPDASTSRFQAVYRASVAVETMEAS